MSEIKSKVALFHKTHPRYAKISQGNGKFHYKSLRLQDTNIIDIKTDINKLGFKALTAEFEQSVQKQAKAFGAILSPNVFSSDGVEIFSSKKVRALLIIEVRRTMGEMVTQVLVLYKTEDDLKKSLDLLRKGKSLKKLIRGTYTESKTKDELNEKLGAVSPAGKLIVDKFYADVFPILKDDSKRKIINKLAESLGEGVKANTQTALLKLFRSVHSKRKASALLEDSRFFEKLYKLGCKKCQKIFWATTYDSVEFAREALKHTKINCSQKGCHSAEFEVVEVFRPSLVTIKTKGGIWLEKALDDELRNMGVVTWPGRMHGGDEIDNTFLVNEEMLIVECKDTSFGQTDLYTLVMKAQNIGADRALIFTTKPIHTNVLSQIEILNKDGELKIEILTGEANKILLGLHTLVQRLNHEFIGKMIRRKSQYLDSRY